MEKNINLLKAEKELLLDIENTKSKTTKKILSSMYDEYISLSESDEYSRDFKAGYFASICSLIRVYHEVKPAAKDFNDALNYRVTDYNKLG